jgi:cytochrome c-type biogenesis protein CcmH
LGLLGIAAFEAGDYAGALTHWRRLLAQLPPDSGNARAIEQGIRQAEAALGEAGEAPAATAGPQLQVAISLAPALQAQLPEGGTLFVFARAVGGPPLPLAVVKHSAPQLPLQVELDDSLAMAPGSNLSGALASGGAVEVVARITASGQVFGAPGDLEGSSGPLTLTGDPQPLSVTIDRRL